jgi:hypothetical protein
MYGEWGVRYMRKILMELSFHPFQALEHVFALVDVFLGDSGLMGKRFQICQQYHKFN